MIRKPYNCFTLFKYDHKVGDGDLERLDESVKQNPNANTPPVKKRITPNS